MDLRKDAKPMDPATLLANSLSMDGPMPCYVDGGPRRQKHRSASISSVDIRGPTPQEPRNRRRKSFTFDSKGNVVGGGSDARRAAADDEETKEEKPTEPYKPVDATCIVNLPPTPEPAPKAEGVETPDSVDDEEGALLRPEDRILDGLGADDDGGADFMELCIEGLDDEWI